MIIKGHTYLFFLACLTMAFMVYFIANKVHEIDARIQNTSEKLARYDEELKVLEAEWSYLNNPQRLSRLSAKLHNDMASPARAQFTSLKDLPLRSVQVTSASSNVIP